LALLYRLTVIVLFSFWQKFLINTIFYYPTINNFMKTGKVKWFNTQKGYGFIITEEGKDLFVHFKDVQGGVNAIKDNDDVTYEVEEGRKGLQAVNVKKA
jgi:CspA family cold shock protein